jgi:alkanesulfonate monooxygenase SsuD/methylene tetrahydromethanopterin reductase-like flavin-dependent oxidoreductase (luciferase family)|tara:strand:- start:11643 stop:11807 length:165 start_codon:yes stop_codon:yes gene_type:complete
MDWLIVVGEPEECADRIGQLQKSGASSLVLMPLMMEDAASLLRLTAEEVLPRIS